MQELLVGSTECTQISPRTVTAALYPFYSLPTFIFLVKCTYSFVICLKLFICVCFLIRLVLFLRGEMEQSINLLMDILKCDLQNCVMYQCPLTHSLIHIFKIICGKSEPLGFVSSSSHENYSFNFLNNM